MRHLIWIYTITEAYLYNFDPLTPHFYIVKLGFTGVCIIFLMSAQNIDCGYSLEPPHRGGSNEYPQSMFWAKNMKNIRIFYLKIFIFLVVKFWVYLNRHVFIMLFATILLFFFFFFFFVCVCVFFVFFLFILFFFFFTKIPICYNGYFEIQKMKESSSET